MEKYSNVIIYYFTGTGNALNVARWFEISAGEMNVECQKVNVSEIDSYSLEQHKSGTLIAFVSPVHGFNYPPVMLNFISHFPRGNSDVVLLNTRAGMLIRKWVTPGLSGITFYLSALILKFKGYSIIGLLAVDLPSNWISVHPGLNKRTILFLHEKMKLKVISFAQKIINGKKSYKPLIEIIQDAAISPVALLYYLFGRFFLAKTYFASSICDNCGVCVNKCPVNAIILKNGKPFWKLKCESCMRCMSNCPRKAIETAHGFVFAVSIIFHYVVLGFINSYFSDYAASINPLFYSWVVQSILFLIFIVISYRIMYLLKRFKWFDKILVYTSLTYYKFWGKRYKAVKDF